MKKLTALLLVLNMAVSLAACGSGAPGGSQSLQPDQSNPTVNETPAPTTPDTPADTSSTTPDPSEGVTNSTLVAYFSATGNTEGIAQHLQAILDADLYEIVPAEPYSDDDLNYNVSDCRANQEQNDPDARPAIDGTVENMDGYDVIFLGYRRGSAPRV